MKNSDIFHISAQNTEHILPEAPKEGEMRNKQWGNKRHIWNHREAAIDCFRVVLSVSSLSALRNFSLSKIRPLKTELPARRHWLIWIFTGRTCPWVRFLTLRSFIVVCVFTLSVVDFSDPCINCHYENMPIQIYWKFYNQKMKIFR